MTPSRASALTLKSRGPDRLVLSPPLSYRVLFGVLLALALVILASALWAVGGPAARPRTIRASIILAAAMALGLLYNDCWIFDRRLRTVESRFGLFLICRRRRIPMDSVSMLRMDPVGVMVRLVAVRSGGKSVVIESARASHRQGLEGTGKRIAGFCGVPFTS